jgi:hypothetical protein
MTVRSLLQVVFAAALSFACAPQVVLIPPQRPMLIEANSPPVLVGQAPVAAPSVVGPQGVVEPQGSDLDEGGYHEVSPAAEEGDAVLPQEEPRDADPVALRRFRPDLEPYGQWIEDARYGTVWVPYSNVVGVSFSPYVTAGHWTMTVNDEWLWVSDYPFGGVVFHYGRWVWLPGQGWAWVAGNRYAPSWVQFWVADGGFVGWAPLGPVHIWRAGVVVWVTPRTPRPRVFVPHRHVYSRKVAEHVVSNARELQRLQRHARAERPRPPHAQATEAHAARSPAVTERGVAPHAAPLPPAAARPTPLMARRPKSSSLSSVPRRGAKRPGWSSTVAGPKAHDKALQNKRVKAPASERQQGKRAQASRAEQRRYPERVVVHKAAAPSAPRRARTYKPAVNPAAGHKSLPKKHTSKAQPAPKARSAPHKMKLPPPKAAPPRRAYKALPSGKRRSH